MLNNDTVVDPTALTHLVRVAETDCKIGMAGSKIYYYSDPQRLWFAGGLIQPWRGLTFHIGVNELDQGQYDEVKLTDYVTGCSVLVRRALVDAIGLMDESYYLYYEEADWAIRAQRAGWNVVYVPASMVWHKVSQKSVDWSPQMSYYFTRNSLLFVAKNYSKAYLAAALLLSLRSRLLPQIMHLKRHHLMAVLKGYFDFATGKLGDIT